MPARAFRNVLTLVARSALIACAATAVQAQQLYKNVMPDGRIIYTDAPLPGAAQTKALEAPPPPSPVQRESAQRRAEEDKRKRDELENRLGDRRKAMAEAEDRVARARQNLERAQTALEQGRAPLPGETIGTAGGGVRPTDEYLRRITQMERDVEFAKLAVDEALKARNQAR